jgi:hypothetical protein
MPWHFTFIDNDSRTVTDPASLTVQSRGELSPLQIFVREVLQNSLDNRSGPDPVRVVFRMNILRDSARDFFLKSLQFDQITPHIQAVRQYAKENDRDSDFADPEVWLKSNAPLRVLCVEDYGTRGLIGPEHSLEVQRFPKPHCFLGLCRNIGDSQKAAEAMGGIYGLGKTVLWKHSRYRIVLFHSRLQTPYTFENAPEDWHTSRFFGHLRLPGHHIGKQSYRGEGFWGSRKGDLTWSYLDSAADDWAAVFGIPVRSGHQTGTSILIVDFEDPDADGDSMSPTETLNRIRQAAEDYYWPALTDGSLQVFTKNESENDSETGTRDVLDVPYLAPFIKAYIAARLDKPKTGLHLKAVEVNVPKGPSKEEKCKAAVAVCVSLRGEEADVTKFVNRTALVRGAGMVVGYQRIGRPGIGGSDFYAVVLGGKSCPEYMAPNFIHQDRCEQLLAYSEPVTHDVWTMNSDKLKHWYGARAEIVRILDGIKQAISSATTEEIRPEGKASSLLAAMFPLSEGPEHESARDTHLSFLMPPQMKTENGHRKYEFQIRVTVPARRDFAGGPYSFWKVECKYGFLGEEVGHRLVEKAPVRFTHLRMNGSGWQPLPEPHGTYEAEVEEQELICDLRGETSALETFLSEVTKQELQVKVSKR